MANIENSYTIYANKPESYSRYHDEYYGNTIFKYEISIQEIIDIVTDCMVTNLHLQLDEMGYDFIVLCDGKKILQTNLDSIITEATPIAEARWRLQQEEERKRQEEKERIRKEWLDKQQRQMYENLKKKFEKEDAG